MHADERKMDADKNRAEKLMQSSHGRAPVGVFAPHLAAFICGGKASFRLSRSLKANGD
jgi:hypothetical protein